MAPGSGDPPEGGSAEPQSDFFWFSAALSSWFVSFGMQSTLFSWLLVGELAASLGVTPKTVRRVIQRVNDAAEKKTR